MSLADAAVFQAVHALASIYGDAGAYTRPPAGPVPCRIIVSRQDDAVAFGSQDTQVRVPGWWAEVLQEEVPTRPRKNDTLTLGLLTYRIRDVQEDVERASWRLDIIEA